MAQRVSNIIPGRDSSARNPPARAQTKRCTGARCRAEAGNQGWRGGVEGEARAGGDEWLDGGIGAFCSYFSAAYPLL